MQNALIFPTPIEVYSLFETIAIRATESRKEELRYGKRVIHESRLRTTLTFFLCLW